jgi:hypothetical protein
MSDEAMTSSDEALAESATQPAGAPQMSTPMGKLDRVSPLGVVAAVGGAVMAIVSFVRFTAIAHDATDKSVRAAIQAIELTVVVIWVGVGFWGWYLIKDGFERANTNRRLTQQQHALSRIEVALAEMDQEKEQQTQKSRSFWTFRRDGLTDRRKVIDVSDGATEQVSD